MNIRVAPYLTLSSSTIPVQSEADRVTSLLIWPFRLLRLRFAPFSPRFLSILNAERDFAAARLFRQRLAVAVRPHPDFSGRFPLTCSAHAMLKPKVIVMLWSALATCAGAQSPSDFSPVQLSADQAKSFAATFAPTGTVAEDFSRVRVQRDLEFAKYGDKRLLLDLYLPHVADRDSSSSVRASDQIPCVVMITGGGFKARGKDAFAKYAAFLSTQGFVTASISYRGAPDDPFPSSVQDSKAAVRYLRSNASRFGLDGDRIAALGQSAGGHLAAMLAVSGDFEEFEGNGGNAGVSSRIQAAVSFAGVFDFISRLRDGGHQETGVATKRKTNGAWVGEPFSVDSERWVRASPINHLSVDDPPILLVHTKTDQVVPMAQSMQMHETMQRKGLTSRLLIFDTGGHGVASAPAINERVWQQTVGFLREHLGK